MRTQKEEETASESKKTCAKQMSKMELEQVVGVQISFFLVYNSDFDHVCSSFCAK